MAPLGCSGSVVLVWGLTDADRLELRAWTMTTMSQAPTGGVCMSVAVEELLGFGEWCGNA